MSLQSSTLFFDIDGTLLYAKGSGRSAFKDAFYDVFDVNIDISHINFYGATDMGVINRLLYENNLRHQHQRIPSFFNRLAFHLEDNLSISPPILYPGVFEFLALVHTNHKLSIITGNTYKCASLKLKYSGVSHFFSNKGGYGDDSECRNEIAKYAIQRTGKVIRGFLFGDTPNDIIAAKENNLISIALCTGMFKKEDFVEYHPDFILESFQETNNILRLLEL